MGLNKVIQCLVICVLSVSLNETLAMAKKIQGETLTKERVDSWCGLWVPWHTTKGVLTIPEKYTEIRPYAFTAEKKLKAVHFLGKVSNIPPQAFTGCSELKSVTLPDSVRQISTNAFSCCSSLQSIDLKDTEIIDKNAFHQCSSLNSITISDNIKEIKSDAFSECYKLSRITVTYDNDSFSDADRTRIINLIKEGFATKPLKLYGKYGKEPHLPENVSVEFIAKK